jgi:hypothetical protein
MKLLLNECALLPLHWLQKFFASSEKALVIYFEARYEPQENTDDR